jgi:hypothetical protein
MDWTQGVHHHHAGRNRMFVTTGLAASHPSSPLLSPLPLHCPVPSGSLCPLSQLCLPGLPLSLCEVNAGAIGLGVGLSSCHPHLPVTLPSPREGQKGMGWR